MADDDFLMMMSPTVQNNANLDNLEVLLSQPNYNPDHYMPYVVKDMQNTGQVTLSEGGYYYF